MKRLFFTLLIFWAASSLWAQERPRVALVLGGGGAKGAAAVGVLKYVEQSGVPIDMVVGTSIGSIVGGLYSLGYRSAQLDSLFRTRDWVGMGVGSLMGDSVVTVLRTLAEAAPAVERGMRIDSVSFDSLPIPFRCVAVDMRHLREVVLSSGNLAQAMRASMAIPLVFKPVKMDGMMLVDGGVLNNLPVDVAKEMGADVIIAVDLTVNKHKDGKGLFLRPDLQKYEENLQGVDVYINPRLKGYGPQDFVEERVAEMIAIGERAGRASLKDLKRLKKRLE